ncbi:MAG: pyridoxal phosphate-dependent aminotransferase [Candidatus Ancillula sp.]|nr:pyridoxal phosphate-dependent aminotransferase [Candidatus Ancillula sp.]
MTLENSRATNAIKPSATLEIDALAKKLKAQGRPVISFAAGEPDFATPSFIVDAATDAARNPAAQKYTPAAGLPELREAVALQINQEQKLASGATFTAEDVVVTNGGKEAVFLSLAVTLDPGDEVLIACPAWLTYQELIAYFGAKCVEVLGAQECSYKVSVAQLEANCTTKTKLLILNSPSNPTGAIYSEDELREIGEWCRLKGIWVIADEIYEYLIYSDVLKRRQEKGFDTAPHILETVPELRENVIIINGVAKSSAMTGWRIGWLAGPEKIVRNAKKLKSHLSSNTNNIGQFAALEALNAYNSGRKVELHKMRDQFAKRAELIYALLSEITAFDVIKPQGAFYAFVNVSRALNTPLGSSQVVAESAQELAMILLNEINVAVVPMDAFGIEDHIRLSYALGEDDLTEGIGRMKRFIG